MGFEVGRFRGDVDEELICPICSAVLEDPVQAPECEHAFCSVCIHEWLSRQRTCPVDRNPISSQQLKPVPRILRNLLSRLYIACDNASFGCSAVIKLDSLQQHLEECEHNPKRPVQCEQGCGMVIPKDELKTHNCVRELRAVVEEQASKIGDYRAEVEDVKRSLAEHRHEMQMLKDYIRAIRVSTPNANPSVQAIEDELENNEIVRWVNTVPLAKVTRWGGMISTPDAVLQAVIKRSLQEIGCPPHLATELMENAHERNWPHGLSTLETRQMNRHLYERYVTRRIPGKQAVLVMACDNVHMGEEMSLEPGLVMIFAHGIE
ncbi:E3 ubiquitin-protein ligase NRDP1-like [Acanthaster planci]|uniref:E3 ubiquitin-protein ligase NRDP1 n=1 Tax=Acanthaster planci TaxID=133434 RepID=A0A8B7ZCH0_ACAPL|nr:E3 ubiquitin-protein ligase NRDP1-like [Acanthaster planci]XP_022102677.1 E3 ubiquitin-protein ligase NRDP1-like [Acanthaster planci]XP_022102686.1 E3 ubiquitin-protein ligase NRDP1-like [Acanthaster planci]XP_022102697.1 E3 ubiquitin-protein ligase NRDP1-like [Acanthaster planci]XP_022102708.1 E3 ubiquitin-protein ligase NRDP1-like [Acanthaster planci]